MVNWNRWFLLVQRSEIKPWQWFVIAFGIATAIWLIFRIRAYFREDAEDTDQTLEMLTQFRELHQEGGLSDDEFRLIRSRLAHTAQATADAGKAKTNAISADPGALMTLRSLQKSSSHSTAIDTTIEDDLKSARTTDEETE